MTNATKIKVRLIPTPRALPQGASLGRTVLLDLAFAFDDDFERSTRPFIDARNADDSLAMWIDHHSHPQWPAYLKDPRFVLVPRKQAPACPELITAERVELCGKVDRIMAHADFDGCMAAAKFLRGGRSVYEDADNDARAIDTPGRGFICSPQGHRTALALEYARGQLGLSKYLKFAEKQLWAWVHGVEDPAFAQEIDGLADAGRGRLDELRRLADAAIAPEKDILLCTVNEPLSSSDRKTLLRLLEERSRVAILSESDSHKISLGSFDESLDLKGLPGMVGWAGFCWGEAQLPKVLEHVRARLLAATA